MSEQERYRGNLRHPLVRKAATFQATSREQLSRARRKISELINSCQDIHARDMLLTSLITGTSHPEAATREASINELERLFNMAPDGMQPLQAPFQEPDSNDLLLGILQDALELSRVRNEAGLETRIERAIELIQGLG